MEQATSNQARYVAYLRSPAFTVTAVRTDIPPYYVRLDDAELAASYRVAMKQLDEVFAYLDGSAGLLDIFDEHTSAEKLTKAVELCQRETATLLVASNTWPPESRHLLDTLEGHSIAFLDLAPMLGAATNGTPKQSPEY